MAPVLLYFLFLLIVVVYSTDGLSETIFLPLVGRSKAAYTPPSPDPLVGYIGYAVVAVSYFCYKFVRTEVIYSEESFPNTFSSSHVNKKSRTILVSNFETSGRTIKVASYTYGAKDNFFYQIYKSSNSFFSL